MILLFVVVLRRLPKGNQADGGKAVKTWCESCPKGTAAMLAQ
jgi:hypothetical protein